MFIDNAGHLRNDFYQQATEIQIDESGKDAGGVRFGSSLHKTGALYGISPALQWASKVAAPTDFDGYWNEYDVLVLNRTITVRLNSALILNGVPLPDNRPVRGFIGIQLHTGVVQFRHIRIHQLNPTQ